jgi:hypothetical protein
VRVTGAALFAWVLHGSCRSPRIHLRRAIVAVLDSRSVITTPDRQIAEAGGETAAARSTCQPLRRWHFQHASSLGRRRRAALVALQPPERRSEVSERAFELAPFGNAWAWSIVAGDEAGRSRMVIVYILVAVSSALLATAALWPFVGLDGVPYSLLIAFGAEVLVACLLASRSGL